MSESIPSEPLTDNDDDQEFLEDTFIEKTHLDWRRRHEGHDARGYFAELAGSAQCLELGHGPERDEDEVLEGLHEDWVEQHPHSWDGDRLCISTRYGTACTACEGECDVFESNVALWGLPGVTGARE